MEQGKIRFETLQVYAAPDSGLFRVSFGIEQSDDINYNIEQAFSQV